MTIAIQATDPLAREAIVHPSSSVELRQVIERYEAPLLRHATRILRDVERARDVVQDTFVKLCEARIALDDPRLKPWLFTVCRNRAIDILRRESRLAITENTPEIATPPREADQRALSEVFEQIAEMPPMRVRVLELRFREGHSYRRIAELMGMSVSHVGVVIHKSVASLRKQMAAVAMLALLMGGAWYAVESPVPATFAPDRARPRSTIETLLAAPSEPVAPSQKSDPHPPAPAPPRLAVPAADSEAAPMQQPAAARRSPTQRAKKAKPLDVPRAQEHAAEAPAALDSPPALDPPQSSQPQSSQPQSSQPRAPEPPASPPRAPEPPASPPQAREPQAAPLDNAF